MKHLLIAGLLAGSVALPAAAEGFYAGGALGGARLSDMDERANAVVEANIDAGATWARAEYRNWNGAAKVFGGYQLNRYLAFEGGYAYLGKHKLNLDAEYPLTDFSYRARWEIGAVFADALVMLPLADNFSLFGRLGLAVTETEFRARNSDGETSRADKSEDVVKYGLGGEYVIAGKYAVRAEYERYPDVGDAATTGEADIDVLSVGFNYKF